MQIKAPDLGVKNAEVIEILVSVGDIISDNDNIILVESDKVSVEIPSSASGKVTAITVAVGDTISEGSVLLELAANAGQNTDNTIRNNDNINTSNNPATTSAEKSENTPLTNQQQQEDKASEANNTPSTQSSRSGRYALPDLGVEQAQVAEVMVKVGDTVAADESILLIESDKASVEVPAPVAGVIEAILVKAGDTVSNGQDFIVIKAAGVAASSDANTDDNTDNNTDNNINSAASKSPSLSAVSKRTPTDVESQQAQEQSPQAASTSTNANTSTNVNTSTSANVGYQKLDEAAVTAKMSDIYAGPAVRKLARQLGVDITQVVGSAINQRVLKEDVFGYVKATMQNSSAAATDAVTTTVQQARSALPPLPDMSNRDIWGKIDTQDLTRLQKVSIPQLNYNTYLPQVTQFDLSDITDTEKLRGELKGELKAQGIGLTILAFIVKATAYALTQYPRFNSHLSDDNSQIYLRKTVNMGMAVATDDGLIVPVLKDVQDKGIKQIAIEIGELASKARDKKLRSHELQGASFTLSSQGNLGGTYFTPLVNWPQVAILGISEASMQPRWNPQSQTFEPRLMLPLSLSYDHRVINGADAAVFTHYVASLLADTRRILL